MESFVRLFGSGENLTALQMSLRGIVVFFFTLLMIRISGRRSFGIKTPFDTIIVILLGTLLGRAVVGVSPFIPILATSLVVVIIHRSLGFVASRSAKAMELLAGEKILLFEEGHFIEKNLRKTLLNKEDVRQGVRKALLTEDFGRVDKIYFENTGEITVVEKVSK